MSSSPVESSIAPAPARDAYRDRRPPYSEDAEQAVLGAILLDSNAFARAIEVVGDADFYREAHRVCFRAMRGLVERGVVIDALTLADELARQGDLGRLGGAEYLAELVAAVSTTANLEYHARIVREKALLRRLIEVSTGLIGEAFEARSTAGELIDEAERRVFELGQQRGSEGFSRLKDILWPAMEDIEALMARGGGMTGVPSGFADLDKLTLGFQPGNLVIIAARPSVGKTAFVLNIAQYAALERNTPIAIFSLEMSKNELGKRMLACEGMVDAQKIRSGKLGSDELARLGRALGLLGPAPILIDDTAGLGLAELRSKARRLKAEYDVQMVVVDYLQLMEGPKNAESRQQEVSAISRGLKLLAKELGVPVVALSQLSRAPEQRTGENKRPQLSDLRESGAIEQDADVVIFLYRRDAHEKAYDAGGNPVTTDDGIPIDGLAEVIVAKQRNGPTGDLRLFFHKSYTRFDNFSARQHG
jgi:replicative DNA helicase